MGQLRKQIKTEEVKEVKLNASFFGSASRCGSKLIKHGFGRLVSNQIVHYEGYFRGDRPFLLGRIYLSPDLYFLGNPDCLQPNGKGYGMIYNNMG